MAPRAKPYRFSELERWTRSQLLVLKTFMAYLPGSALGGDFKASIRDAIGKLTGAEVDIWLDSITPTGGAAVLQALPEPACLALIGLQPTDHHIVLDPNPQLPILQVLREEIQSALTISGGADRQKMSLWRFLTCDHSRSLVVTHVILRTYRIDSKPLSAGTSVAQ